MGIIRPIARVATVYLGSLSRQRQSESHVSIFPKYDASAGRNGSMSIAEQRFLLRRTFFYCCASASLVLRHLNPEPILRGGAFSQWPPARVDRHPRGKDTRQVRGRSCCLRSSPEGPREEGLWATGLANGRPLIFDRGTLSSGVYPAPRTRTTAPGCATPRRASGCYCCPACEYITAESSPCIHSRVDIEPHRRAH